MPNRYSTKKPPFWRFLYYSRGYLHHILDVFAGFDRSADTLGTDLDFLAVDVLCLDIDSLGSFGGDVGVAAGLAGGGSSTANLTCSAHMK